MDIDSLTVENIVASELQGALGQKPISWSLDENFEVGNTPPLDLRQDLAVPRTDLDELTDRKGQLELGMTEIDGTIFTMEAQSTSKHGPNWCDHCKVNHWKKTKCPYKSNEGQPKTEEPKVPENIQPPEDVKFWHQQNWTQELFGKSNVPGPPDMPYAWTQGGGGQQLIAELSHGAQSAEELSAIFGDKAILSALLTDGVTKGFFKKTKDG